jgi:hypothetical protein
MIEQHQPELLPKGKKADVVVQFDELITDSYVPAFGSAVVLLFSPASTSGGSHRK